MGQNNMRYLLLVSVTALAACGSSHSPSEPRMGSASWKHVAQVAAESGDTQMAENIYATDATNNPGDASKQLVYADMLLRQNKVTQAREVLARGVKTASEPQLLRGGLGALYVLEGQPQQAIAEFDAVLGSSPNDSRWLVNKAIALDLLKRHDEAQILYKRALTIEPDDATTKIDLALSLDLSGKKAQAAEVVASLAGRADLSAREQTTIAVVRRDPTNDQVMRLAKAIDGAHTNTP